MTRKRKRKPKDGKPVWLHVLVIILLGIVVFANSHFNDFSYDDKVLVRDNDFIKDWNNLHLLVSPSDYYSSASEDNYIPVTTLSFFINHSMSGVNPFGFHLTNTLFHILNSILLYTIVAATLKKRFVALLCAAFFITHPIHTESVTWIAGRTDVLSAFFFLTAILLHIRSVSADSGAGIGFYAGSLAAFVVSLFAKEMSITLLPVIVLYDVCFRRANVKRWAKERYLRYSGYLAVTALFFAGKFLFFSKGFEIGLYPGGSLYTSMLTMSRAVVFYIRMLIMPVNLSISHLFPVSITVSDPRVLFSISSIVALLITAVMIRKRSIETSFSIGYFFVTLLPVSHLIPIPGGVVAERYLYIPSIGFAFLLAILVDTVSRSVGKRVAGAISLAIVMLYSAGTVMRNRDWRDETTLWTRTIELYPENGAAYLYRGHTLWESGRYRESISDYSKAIAITPNDPEGFVSRGISYAAQGEIDSAIADFSSAIELDPVSIKSFYNRGISYAQKGSYDRALSDFDRVISLDPGHAEAYNNRGVVYSRIESYDLARKDFTRAIELNPDHVGAYRNRGLVYRLIGKEDLAEADEAKARFLSRRFGE